MPQVYLQILQIMTSHCWIKTLRPVTHAGINNDLFHINEKEGQLLAPLSVFHTNRSVYQHIFIIFANAANGKETNGNTAVNTCQAFP